MRRHRKEIVGLLLLLPLALLALAPLTIFSQEAAQNSGQQRKILDLVFRVEDMAGKVQDMQVKETSSEIHIELSSDVLFDFDKADIRPAARDALRQAAAIIREHSKHGAHRRPHRLNRLRCLQLATTQL